MRVTIKMAKGQVTLLNDLLSARSINLRYTTIRMAASRHMLVAHFADETDDKTTLHLVVAAGTPKEIGKAALAIRNHLTAMRHAELRNK